jgi:hypothetical protein
MDHFCSDTSYVCPIPASGYSQEMAALPFGYCISVVLEQAAPYGCGDGSVLPGYAEMWIDASDYRMPIDGRYARLIWENDNCSGNHSFTFAYYCDQCVTGFSSYSTLKLRCVSSTPGTPVTPGTPLTPQPGTPVAPVAPQPGTPITPVTPVTPGTPVTPQPGTPVTPQQPVTPITPSPPKPPTPVPPKAPSPNRPPYVKKTIPDQIVKVNAPFYFQIEDTVFTDPDNDPLDYSVSQSNGDSLPDWLVLSQNSRVLSGTPDQIDTISLRLIATDTHGLSASTTFKIIILEKTAEPSGSSDNLRGLIGDTFGGIFLLIIAVVAGFFAAN